MDLPLDFQLGQSARAQREHRQDGRTCGRLCTTPTARGAGRNTLGPRGPAGPWALVAPFCEAGPWGQKRGALGDG